MEFVALFIMFTLDMHDIFKVWFSGKNSFFLFGPQLQIPLEGMVAN
jgi:hypothetical protein